MNHYRVLLNGEDFLINVDSKPTYMGFYTTRFVSSVTPEEAELKAVNNIKADDKIISIMLNDATHKEPMIYMDEIKEIKESQKEENYGFGWYNMDGSND